MAMSRPWKRAVGWAAVAALGAGLVSSVVSAQPPRATVTAYGFELSCDASVSEGSPLACTLSNTSDEAADWPTVGIVHLSSDDDRALVVGSPVDVAFGALEGGPETEDDVWWIGDVLVGYSRFDWDGQATASSGSETTDSRTVNIVVADDTAWEEAESFYVALAPSGARGVGFLYDHRQKITIRRSDSKSGDATLASLVISAGGTTTKLTPPPISHPLTAEYTTTELTVAPTATYKPSGISVAVDSGAAYSFAAQSGDETRAIPLAVGINTISVTVTAEDGASSQAYKVVVDRVSLVDGATVTASSDGFSLTCPGTVAEGSTMECTLTSLSTSPADWPVVAFLHSSADVSRALIAEDPIIPESSLLYSQDIRLTDPQVPAVDNYNYGYGELFSGGSRSVYATYGYEKFDWFGPAEASTSRNVFVEILADGLDEGNEIFYAAIADSGYTGLSDLVDNKVPIVVRGTSSTVPIEAIGKHEAADVFWTGLDAIDGEPVTSYDLRYIRSDATDRSDGSWEVRASIWPPGDGVLAFELSGLVNDVSYDIQLRAVAGTTTGPWSTTQTVTPRPSNEAPAFPDTETGQRSVVEGAIAGRSVGAPISATDREGDTLLYSLQSGGDVFDIRAATGQLSTKAELDYETAATHSVVIAVSDGKDLDHESDPAVDATVEVTVAVIDVNEPPAFPDTETGQRSVVEGAIAGRSVGAPISATDPEGDTLLYSLQSGGDVFDIRAATGQLSTKAELDYETAATHSVVIAVSDGKDLDGESDPAVDATVEVTVAVIDVNEPPAFPDTETGQRSVVEGAIAGRSVGAPISATDPEGDTLVYSLQSGGDVFDIRAATGQLLTKAELDYETAATHSVVIAVSDGKDLDGEPDAAVDATVDVTVSVTDVAEWSVTAVPARVAEGAVSTVTVSVDKEFEADQTITLTVGGTAASGDYSLSSLSLTLGAGDMSVTASVTAVDDSVIDGGDETVVVTASHGGGAVGSATVTIGDNDTAVWSVVAVPARVVEGAVSTVTVSVGKEFEADQTITLAVGGTAASGDYSLSSLSLTLGAGDTSVTASVTAVDDSVIDGGDETVVVTASHGDETVGSATVTIGDNDTAVWSVVAVPARVVEGAVSTVTVSVGKEFEADQTITLAATGTAASADYSLSPTSSLTLVAGDTSVTASVTAVDDSVIDGGDETVVVTASHGGGAVGSATVTIGDNDTAVWSVVAVPARVVEGAASTVMVSVGKEFEVDQTITLAAVGGTAASADYSLSSLSLTLVAGDMSVTATVTAVDDSDEESDETVVVTASHGDGAVGSATVTIEANDTPTWSVVAVPARVAEGAVSTVTVSVDKAFEADQTITLTVGGTAASGDYSLSSLSLTLVAGDMSVTASVTAVDDSVIDGGDETVVVTASHGGGAVGSATVTIGDNDTPTWSVTAVPARVVEGAVSTVTVSVGKEFEADQTITLAVGGTAASGDYSLSSLSLTLGAGDMSVTASVTAVDDSVIDGGDETVVVTASHGDETVGSATVTIGDNDTAVWSVVAVPARVVEGAVSTVTVSVGKEFEADQTITLAATGTAASADYSLSPSLSLTLVAGDMSVTASVTAVDDSVIDGGDETVVVTASHGGGAVGSATVTIGDNDTAVWSVVAVPARVVEGAASTVTVSVDKEFSVDQTITLAATGGTAASGDYSLSSLSLTLVAGDTSVTASVTAVDDSDEESDETVVVTASHGDETVGSATVTIEANDMPVSTDAALSSLVLSGVSIGNFDADTTAYAASVGNGVSSTTVTAVASDDGASVVIADGDGETQGTSRSVSLVVGDNEITVTVTAEDAATTKTYTITVARAEPAVAPLPPGVVWGDRLPDRDIALPGASSSSGVWSDGTDVWVVTGAGKISVYSLADGAEHTDRGFTLPGGAAYAAGLWSDGATLWVADVNSGWVRAYRLSDGARQADRDLDTARNGEPAGIWSDGTTMWVADFTDSRVHAYDLTTKARVADKELDLDKNPGETYNPFGIWSNGDTLLAASWFGSEIIAHSLADGQRQPAKDLSTFASRTNSPNGIWSNGHILWVVDASAATLYAYAVPGLGTPPNDTPTWSVTAVPARVAEGAVSTVTVSVDKEFEADQTITLTVGGTAASGDYSLSSLSLTLGAGDMSVTASVTAVDDSVIDGGDETVVVTASHGGGAVGSATVTIGDNDTAVWSVTAVPARVVEGAVSTVTVSVGKEFEVDQTITLAVGGTAASGDYSLSSLSLTLGAGDTSVTASVTAVDDSVIDGGDETVVVTASHGDETVGSATVTIGDNDTAVWSVVAVPARVVEGAVSTVTVSVGKEFEVDQTITLAATGTAASADYSLSPTLSLTLVAGDTSVTASVTAVDDSVIDGGDETVVVTASHGGGAVGSATVTIGDNDTAVWSVVAVPARVVEGAASTVTVSVGKEFEVDQTITLAATGTAASGDYSLSPSLSLTLVAGDMSVTATVTAVDDSDEESDETVVVTASHGDGAVGSATVTIEANDTPTWSVVAVPARVVEGAVSTVTVSVDKEFEADQTITLTVGGTAASGDYSLSSLSLTLVAGDMSVTASVTAVDDSVIDGGDETVVVTASHGGGAVGSATVTIGDNDTPTWSVTAVPARVVEGAVSTVTVSVGKEFEADQTITLAVGGTAASGDYSLSSLSLTLVAGDMSVTASVTAVDDSVIDGGDETVVVTASHGDETVGSATVTIGDNDTAVWSVAAVPARVVEGAVSTVTVSVGKEFEADQTITLAATGTAASADYSLSPSLSLTLVAGDMSVTASVTAVDDSVIDGGDETVVVTASHGGGAVGSATVTIGDNDTAVWSVVAVPARVVEGAASTVTVSVDKEFSVDQTITLAATGGTAASGDYSLSSLSLTLVAGDTSVTASVTAVDDSDEESDETVVVTASHGDETVGSATVTIEANDMPVSTDAALSSLVLSGVSIGNFDADTTAYAASVGNGVSSTTVTAVASDDGASVVIADGDGETQGTSRSVSLVVGDNEITVTVTAEDAATTKTYTITVARAEPAVAPLPPGVVWGDRLPDRDIALPGASSSSGVWSDGTDVWVVTGAGKISVYSLADGAEHTDRGFTLPGGAAYAAGLWSDGATLWVADVNSGWVRAYRLSDGARQADRDLDTARNGEPAGIWSDGTTMWVADFTDSRVHAYDLTTKARVADKELDLDKNPGETYNPFGIWSNGDTLLAASWFGSEIIAHSLADGQRQPAKDLSTFASRTNSPNGIWSNGHILWVVDASAATLYAYAVPGLGTPPNDTPTWSVTAVPARVAEGAVSTVTVSVDKEFEADQTITLTVGGTAASGDYSLSSLSLTLGAGDMSVTASVTAVDDSVIDGGDETVVVTASHGGGAVGSATVTIGDNDTAVWSVTAVPARVVEGAVSTVTVSVGKEFEVDQTITLAVGGTAASGDYSLSSLSLTLGAGDTSVTASVTAVDDSVIDGGDETVVVTASHGDETVGSATVTIGDNDTAVWSVVAVPARVVEGAVSTVTVSVGKEFEVDQTITLAATGTAASADYSLSPTLSLTLVAGDTSVTASVTAVDDSVIDGGDETVVVTASHGGGAVGSATVTIGDNDTAVWSVVAVPARVVEGAASTVTVSVGKEFEVDQTITLAATGTAASGDYSLSPSLSLTLVAGDMSVTATVTAVDDSDEESDETVVVTASHGDGAVGSATVTIEANDTPTWSVVAVPARVVEGAVSTVTVSVDKEFEADQTITLTVGGTAASGDYSLSSLSLTLVAGDMSVTASVTAVDDSVIDGGDETVVVTASHGGGAVGSATVTIGDNDTPTWSVTAVPARVVEGAVSTVTVSVGKEFEADQTITLAVGGTAASGDYSLSSLSLTLVAGDMSVTASVTAVDDSVIDGGDETVVVTASHGDETVGSATVTIGDNDTAVWSVAAVPARVVEGAASTVTVSVGKEFEVDQTITLAAVGGTAASADYSLSPSLSLTLVAGDMSVTASVTAVDDSVIDGGDETVVVTASHGGGAVGSATVTIGDNDTAVWSVVAVPARVVEGAASTVTVSVDKEFSVDQTITLAATGGTAASGDYSLSSLSLTLVAGDTSVTASVTAVDDSDEESDETVVVTASHGDETVGSATVTIEANDMPVSTDAALSSLVLSGVSIGNFDADTTAYAASVGNGVSSTTVTAVASDDGASVVIADGDGETQGTSRSVSLVVGDNEITVTVTAEDAATTKTYTITVARAVAPLPPGVVWGDRLPDRDIALPGASSSSGVWSDGTDVWVVTGAGKISVYSLADGAEHTDRGFTLPGGAEYAAGLWSDGATLWVADVNSGWVRAYRLSDGARQADRDLDTAALDTAGNGEPAGIWSDGTTMWVADFTDSRVYAYDLTTKARVADKELDLDKNPGETYNPFGIWSNGDTLLAASWFGSEIIAHSLADGQRQPAKDLSTFASRTNSPNGIWSNGHILWVVDASAATLYAYAVPGLGTPPNDTPGSGD